MIFSFMGIIGDSARGTSCRFYGINECIFHNYFFFFSFKGVNWPPSIDQTSGVNSKRLIFPNYRIRSIGQFLQFLQLLFIWYYNLVCSSYVYLWITAHSLIKSKSSCIMAAGIFCPSPITIISNKSRLLHRIFNKLWCNIFTSGSFEHFFLTIRDFKNPSLSKQHQYQVEITIDDNFIG
jgi:hypothetical protein